MYQLSDSIHFVRMSVNLKFFIERHPHAKHLAYSLSFVFSANKQVVAC